MYPTGNRIGWGRNQTSTHRDISKRCTRRRTSACLFLSEDRSFRFDDCDVISLVESNGIGSAAMGIRMAANTSVRQRLIGVIKRFVRWFLLGLLGYFGILLLGLIPVNNDFHPANTGIQIYVVSNAVHADIVVPKTSAVIDWSNEFRSSGIFKDIRNHSHVAFGWGDRKFFLETESWDDLKLSTAVNALLLPSSSCIHVASVHPDNYRNAVAVTISQEQYKRLVEFIRKSFRLDNDGGYLQIPGEAYSTNDAFYLSAGRYHLLNTCNSWVGRGLKHAGVKTPLFSPMPKSPTLYIENEQLAK